MRLTYQPITQQDVENIFRMTKEHILQYENLKLIDCDQVFAWCHRKIEHQSGDYRRIFCGEELAGYVAVHQESDTKREIDDFYLLEPFREKGIGTQVLNQIIENTKRDGKTLFLYVFIRNEGAVRLYRKMGFKVTETIKDSRYIMERK